MGFLSKIKSWFKKRKKHTVIKTPTNTGATGGNAAINPTFKNECFLSIDENKLFVHLKNEEKIAGFQFDVICRNKENIDFVKAVTTSRSIIGHYITVTEVRDNIFRVLCFVMPGNDKEKSYFTGNCGAVAEIEFTQEPENPYITAYQGTTPSGNVAFSDYNGKKVNVKYK